MALFGVANIPHHITSKVLARDGGINAFRDYIPEIVHEVEESVPEFRLDQFFGSHSPMGQSKVATVAGGLSSSAVRRSSSSSNVSHVPTGTPAGITSYLFLLYTPRLASNIYPSQQPLSLLSIRPLNTNTLHTSIIEATCGDDRVEMLSFQLSIYLPLPSTHLPYHIPFVPPPSTHLPSHIPLCTLY